jgi:very-short-patch-repair endonuclease
MASLKQLCEIIADALYVEKSYNLPQVCEDLGLEAGTEEEACQSKRGYVLRRLSGKSQDFILETAYRVLQRYEPIELRKVLGEFTSDVHQLTLVTRQNLLDELILMEREHHQVLCGKLGLVDFLRRMWPLDEMPSTDYRFKTAADDVLQHMVVNDDWDYHYLFDSYLGLLKGLDEDFLRFLEEVVHPVVRGPNTQEQYVEVINRHLLADGFKLQAREQISGYPVYRAVRITAGVEQNVKNLIFAADGPKPKIVLEDSLNNDIRVVKNAEYCLVYDLPIPHTGLLWGDLVAWWAGLKGRSSPTVETEKQLYVRLAKSLSSKPEQLIFYTYFEKLRPDLGEKLPALIPQVYLHYDPYTLRELKGLKRLPRQRMDFLILFSNHERVVIEVDGIQHYAEGEQASPKKYSEMVAADRKLRLAGYEVYRFGGYELQQQSGKALVEEFFRQLLQKHGVRN